MIFYYVLSLLKIENAKKRGFLIIELAFPLFIVKQTQILCKFLLFIALKASRIEEKKKKKIKKRNKHDSRRKCMKTSKKRTLFISKQLHNLAYEGLHLFELELPIQKVCYRERGGRRPLMSQLQVYLRVLL